MDSGEVLVRFARLAGLDIDQARQWTPLCDGAAARLATRLRPGADERDPRLALAAAGEAYCQFLLARQGHSAQSVKVGDITVSEAVGAGGALESARALRDELLAGAADLLDCGPAGLWRAGAWTRPV